MRILSPSYFRLNYNSGRTHSGMIAYLTEYWQDGIEAPLRELLSGMGLEALPSGTLLKPVLEYNNVDLALVDDNDQPLLLVEMKVDDAEGYKKLRSTDRLIWKGLSRQVLQRCYSTHETIPDYLRQTELYTLRHEMAYGDNPRCLFITLGTGEYAADFESCGQVWKHCGLERFVKAVRAIDLDDELFKQWCRSLEKELSQRKNCWPENQLAQEERAKADADSGDRRGVLQLMRLRQLRRELIDRHKINELGYRTSVYKYGVNADTIMNFISPTDQEPSGCR